VSGSTVLAEQGTLTAMAGGPAGAFERVRPVLAAFTARQLHLGPAGAGAAMKLAVNIMIAATNQAVAEALALAAGAGISPASAYDTLTVSAVASPGRHRRAPRPGRCLRGRLRRRRLLLRSPAAADLTALLSNN
jgi:3-hydroxyisobutyrate dehydrogenase-like beta-hydroxyacid dehydrogenase